MTIAFTIANYSGCHTGAGGHYYSMSTLADALARRECKSLIVVFGDFFPEALNSSPVPVYVVRAGFFQPHRVLEDLLHKNSVTVLHSFDPISHCFSRILSKKLGLGLVHTKPGGANARNLRFFNSPYYIPLCPDFVTFSYENYDFIKNKIAKKDCAVHLIPNRVVRVDEDPTRIASLAAQLQDDAIYLVRVCRIGKVYEDSIIKTIRLAEFLSDRGIKAKALVIGKVQDNRVLEDLDVSNQAVFITDRYFYEDAAKLLKISPFVVAMGRGFMEACSVGRVMLACVKNSGLPVIVNESNFEGLFRKNFSPRCECPSMSIEQNERELEHLFRSLRLDEHVEFAHNAFNKHFFIDAAMDTYLNIYRGARPEPLFSIDRVHHLLINWRFFLKYYVKRIARCVTKS